MAKLHCQRCGQYYRVVKLGAVVLETVGREQRPYLLYHADVMLCLCADRELLRLADQPAAYDDEAGAAFEQELRVKSRACYYAHEYPNPGEQPGYLMRKEEPGNASNVV